jgi:PKD repeat protein
MRSIRLMTVSTLILAGAWACGDGGGVGPNTPPVAAFTAPTSCTPNVPCQFTDASTDADGTISTRSWDFGDASAAVPDQNPLHSFAAAGTFQVKLTVTDNNGATGTVTNAVTVGAAGNLPPTASFVLVDPTGCTAGTPCGFHSTSTDADGQITTTHWDFGDQQSGDGADATHTYAAAGTFTVILTVTDNQGAPGTSTQQLTVSPAASTDCTTSTLSSGQRVVNCSLGITQRSTVKFTLVSRSCELAGNTLRMTAPRDQFVFFNICTRAVGEFYVAKDASGADLVIDAGTSLGLRFGQGTADPGDPASGDPGIQISGSFPNWTLNIDDGGNAGAEGEPDFDDAVISVTATLAP